MYSSTFKTWLLYLSTSAKPRLCAMSAIKLVGSCRMCSGSLSMPLTERSTTSWNPRDETLVLRPTKVHKIPPVNGARERVEAARWLSFAARDFVYIERMLRAVKSRDPVISCSARVSRSVLSVVFLSTRCADHLLFRVG